MNINSKMILIPENEHKARSFYKNVLTKEGEYDNKVQKKSDSEDVLDELSELLKSTLPPSLKMRLFNDLLSRYLVKKPEKTNKPAKVEEPKPVEEELSKPEPIKKDEPISIKEDKTLRRSTRKNKKNIQSGSGRKVIPIKWTTLKKF